MIPVLESFRFKYRRLFCAAAFAASLSVSCVAQTAAGKPASPQQEESAPAGRTAKLTVNARLVVLDVTATDRAGKPIAGLTANDFRVYEDGMLERLRSFEAPDLHQLPASTAQEGTAAVFDPARPKTFGSSPVTVLILDQLNTHFADSSYARRQVHDFLAKQPALLAEPTTLLTLYQNRFKELAPFTCNRDLLLKALAAAPVEYAWTLENNGKAEYGPLERLEASLNALEEIAQNYASIRGRKNLVWVGNGFPGIDPGTLGGRDNAEIESTLQHVTDVLLDTRVTLYAVDPTSTLPGMTEITDTTQQQFVLAGGDSLSGSIDTFGSQDAFDKLGPVSGGRVVRGMNDVSAQISSAIDAGSVYYTLSYSPTSSSTAQAMYRKIRVECLRPGCYANTRQGYFLNTTAPVKGPDMEASSDLSAAAEGSMALHGLSVTATPAGATTGVEERFALAVSAPGLTWTPQEDGSSKASVYVMAVSLDRNGHMLEHTVSAESANAKAGVNLSDESKSATFAMMASPPEKAVTLRFVVRDMTSGRMGSVDIPVNRK